MTDALARSLCALLLWAAAACVAGPAAAEEVAYLMYLKGSEGPPATPIRVLWNVLDDVNARITIDLGARYEPSLTKLGLTRVLAYDARRDKARFIVRAPELTRPLTVRSGMTCTSLSVTVAPAATSIVGAPPTSQGFAVQGRFG